MGIRRSNMHMKKRGGGAAAYRYFRIYCTNANDATYIQHHALEFSEDGGSTIFPPDMTSNTAPSPNVASSNNAPTYLAWHLFDRDAGTYNTNNTSEPSWMKIDLGSGNEKVLNWLRIHASVNYHCIDFTVEGSNDDSTWTVLHTETGNSTADLTISTLAA